MAHRFSNSLDTRIDILRRALEPYKSWEEIPIAGRLDTLLEVAKAVQEALDEVRS